MRKSEEMMVLESKKLLLMNQNLIVAREVPMLGRSIDLVIRKGRTLISIEFKVHDWRKGIKQAKDYLFASDYSYICLPENKKVTPRLLSYASEHGVGIFLFRSEKEWPFVEILKPRKSTKKWRFARIELFRSLRDGTEQRII